METKLTLKLNDGVITRAKGYARKRNTSLSRLIEAYLAAVTSPANNKEDDISPVVKSLSGIIQLPATYDHKKVYGLHIKKKYAKSRE